MTRDYVTIVSGLPRSGTSMMMRMLDDGGIEAMTDKIRAADEDNPKGYYEFEPVKQTKKDPSWLTEAPGKAVKLVYLLLYDLPAGYRYRVLFMRRTLAEVLDSQDVMLKRRGKQQSDMSHEQLVKSFEAQLDKMQSWLAEQDNFEVLYVDYNEMVADPASQVRAIDQFLDGGLDTDAMLGVVDPALYRRRQP